MKRTDEEKLAAIKAIAEAYGNGEAPYGDDPEMGGPSAMSEIIAVLNDEESPMEIKRQFWLELGEEAVKSIGEVKVAGFTDAKVKILEVVYANDPGTEQWIAFVNANEDRIVVSGFSWGYMGEGPTGLFATAKQLGFNVSREQIAGLPQNRVWVMELTGIIKTSPSLPVPSIPGVTVVPLTMDNLPHVIEAIEEATGEIKKGGE